MSLYELEGIPKAYSIQAAEVQKSREAKIQHLLQHVSRISVVLLNVQISKVFLQYFQVI